jgi:hypothetical protein
VHVFVDDSNVFVGASKKKWRLDIQGLATHLEGGRTAEERIVVGSKGSIQKWGEWEQANYQVARDPRGGKEVFVDDALSSQLRDTASRTFPAPGRVLVLATGDGNSNHGRTNFPDAVERALLNQWFVIVYAWKAGCHTTYKVMHAKQQPGFRLIYLDDAPASIRELEVD